MQGQLGWYGFAKVSSVLRIIVRHFRIRSEFLRIDGRDFPVWDIAEASIELFWIWRSVWVDVDFFLGLLLSVESLAHHQMADGEDGGRDGGAVWSGEELAAEEGRGPSRGGWQHCSDASNAAKGERAIGEGLPRGMAMTARRNGERARRIDGRRGKSCVQCVCGHWPAVEAWR